MFFFRKVYVYNSCNANLNRFYVNRKENTAMNECEKVVVPDNEWLSQQTLKKIHSLDQGFNDDVNPKETLVFHLLSICM